MQAAPTEDLAARFQRTIQVGGTLDLPSFQEWLESAGFSRVESIDSPGEYSVRGGILDVFSPGGQPPIRIDLYGDEVETIWEIDLDTMGSDRRIDQTDVVTASAEGVQTDESICSILDLLRPETVAFIAELIEVTEQGRGYFERLVDARGIHPLPETFATMQSRCHAVVDVNQFSSGAAPERSIALPVSPLPTFAEETSKAVVELAELGKAHAVSVFCQNEGELQRFTELKNEFAPDATVEAHVAYLHRGFLWEEVDGNGEAHPLALVPYHELLHRFHARRRIRRVSSGRTIDTFLDIEPGDLVVHRDHGIARFVEFGPLQAQGRLVSRRGAQAGREEYLTLEFDGGAKLHVPASQISLIQKYVGAFRGRPKLSKLGGKKWKRQKEDVAEAVRDLASEMIRVQAAREAMPGVRYPADTPWQKEFEAEFPYSETEDQLAAIAAIKKDMSGERPMDRLVCGDVGFGKTEVAIRAAFKAAEYGKQVAVLVPTTVLAEQHEQTFRSRFRDYPFRIESISRFKTKGEQRSSSAPTGCSQKTCASPTSALSSSTRSSDSASSTSSDCWSSG